MTAEDKRKKLTIRVEQDVLRDIKVYCFDNDTSIQEYVLNLILSDLKAKNIRK